MEQQTYIASYMVKFITIHLDTYMAVQQNKLRTQLAMYTATPSILAKQCFEQLIQATKYYWLFILIFKTAVQIINKMTSMASETYFAL